MGGVPEGGGVRQWAEFVFGGQHCEEILVKQGGIIWEEIVKSVWGWLHERRTVRRGVWVRTEHLCRI
jgi:hypothetical protein